MRRRLNYANVTATLALFFAMSGGAIAAKHYVLNSTKQINPKVLRSLKGKTGKTGPPGPQGAAGKEGSAGKEGAAGKEGKAGEPGTALGYATVSAEGTLNAARSKGVISVTHPVTGLYCFQLSFTPNVATASVNHITGNFKTFDETAAGKADVAAFSATCKAPNDDASVVTADGELIDDGFYVVFN